jgi:hypothetical protein
MKSADDLQLPRDPGPVPATLRDAFTWTRDAERASTPTAMPDDAAVDALAGAVGEEESRFAIIEQLLGSPDGARTLAHVVAGRTSTAATDDYFDAPSDDIPSALLAFADVSASARRRNAISGLKPLLLAASLMLVAGTSWYVFTLPKAGEEVRSAGSAVELLAVPPVVARSPITLTWTSLGADSRYSVEVLDVNDAPVFSNETSLTRVVVPPLALKPGTYRWYVRARAADRTEIRSRVDSFSVR